MRVAELITVDRIVSNGAVTDKHGALELLGTVLARARGDLGPAEVVESLLARESLGSTGVGKGVALPHGRVASGASVAAFARLQPAVEFGAADDAPVDLLFATLIPDSATDGYLQLLGQLAQLFEQPDFRQALRAAPDAATLQRLFQDWSPQEH